MDEKTVAVALADLEVIKSTLRSAYHQNTVIDLAEEYRKLSNRPRSSPMTKALEGTIAKVEAYIATVEEETDE